MSIFLLFSFFSSWSYVFSDGDLPEEGLQVSPLHYDWKLDAGDVRTDDVIVHNFSDVSHEVQVSVEDFYVSDDSKQANFYIPGDEHELKAFDVVNWIVAPENFILQPGETKKLQFSVAVPKDQPTSGYYGAIFFKTSADNAVVENSDGSNFKLGVNYRVGALITLAVQGDQKMKTSGFLEEFAAVRRIFWESPIDIYARLKSEGNVHYQVEGRIEIYRFGKKFTTVMIEPEIMYPGKTRTFVERVHFGLFDYGIYSAKLEMESEDSSIVFEDNIPFFIVIPWIPAITIVGVILFVIILVKLFKKTYVIVRRSDV